jgi:hypothetical protein
MRATHLIGVHSGSGTLIEETVSNTGILDAPSSVSQTVRQRFSTNRNVANSRITADAAT